jgi:hypothetical protein
MQEIEGKLISIGARLNSLVTLTQKLKEDKAKLLIDNDGLVRANRELNKKIEDLENKNINLQLVQKVNGAEEPGNANLKERLDAFITEIDECIARLKG